MAKSNIKRLDLAMACERNKALSPFTLTIKHVRCLESTGQRFLFAYQVDKTTHYDTVDVVNEVLGVRRKLAYFLLPDVVKQRLNDKVYTRWYFEDEDYVYPVQSCKITHLMGSFLWTVDGEQRKCSHVIADPDETQFIRKKPLKRVRRPEVTWQDVTSKPLIVKSTIRRRKRDTLLETA